MEPDLLQVGRDEVDGIAIQHFVVGAGRDNVADGERLLLRRTDNRDVWTFAGGAAAGRVNTFAMNLLVTTIDDLAIADVRPKPPALAEALGGGVARLTNADAADLETRGFLTTRDGGLVPVGGDVLVHTVTGITFQLRFGDIVHDGTAAEGEPRYLMISVGFSPATPGAAPSGEVQERLALLRARFAPWYYIVSGESYRRIMLARKDLAAGT
jgi:hypothetical protein